MNIVSKFFSILCAIFLFATAHSQYMFIKTLGGSGGFDETALAAFEMDTSYMLAGNAYVDNISKDDILLVGLNKKLAPSTTITFTGNAGYGGNNVERVYDMKYMKSDSMVIIAGDITSKSAPLNRDAAIVKIRLGFPMVSFEKSIAFGDSGGMVTLKPVEETIYSICITKDGGIAATGVIGDSVANKQDAFIVKFDANLVIQWYRRLNVSGAMAAAYSIVQDNNENYTIAGSFSTAGNTDVLVCKFSNTGNFIGALTYGDAGIEVAYSITLTPAGDYILTGSISPSSGNTDILVLKLRNNLTSVYAATYGSIVKDIGKKIIVNPDGSSVITGIMSVNPTNADVVLLKIDNSGNLLWSRSYGGTGEDKAFNSIKTSDNGYLMIGQTKSAEFFTTNKDVCAVKVDANGESGCIYEDTLLYTSTINANPVIKFLDLATSNAIPLHYNVNFTMTMGLFNERMPCYKEIPRVKAFAGKDTTICSGRSVLLGADTVAKYGTTPYIYEWFPNIAIDDPSIAHPRVTPLTTTTYYLKVTDASGQIAFDTVVVSVMVETAAFTGLDSSYCTSSMLDILTLADTSSKLYGPGIRFNGTLWYINPEQAGVGTHTIMSISKNKCDTVTKQTTIYAAPCLSTIVDDSSKAAIQSPQGIFTDCNGMIFTTNRSTIVRIDTFGIASIIAGDTTKPAGCIDGHISVATLNSPFGITVHPDGSIYFVDGGSQVVRLLRNDTIYTVVGQCNTTGDVSGVVGADARLFNPFGLAFSPDLRYLYVSEVGNKKVKSIDLLNNYFVSDLFGAGPSGGQNVIVPRAANDAKLYFPGHLATYDDDVFVADQDASMIYRFNKTTNMVYPRAGIHGDPGTTLGDTAVARFNKPIGVSVNCAGHLYVADKENNSIKMVEANMVSNFAGGNSTLSCGDVDGHGSVARLCRPTATSVFVKGFVDIADTDNDKIKRLSIIDWDVGPWIGLDLSDSTYCLGDGPDTLNPRYPCGYYKGPGISYDTAIQKYIFTPPSVVGTYTLTYVFNVSYCLDSMKIPLRVVDNPVFTFPSDTIGICAGQPAVLDAGTYKAYQWSTGATTASISTMVQGKYYVTVQDFNNCFDSDDINVVTRSLPVAEAGHDTTICQGSMHTLSAAASTGSLPLSFTWDNGLGTGVSHNVSPLVTTTYTVTVTDSYNCSDNEQIIITVIPAPAANAGKDTTICQGHNISLGGSPTGPSGSTYLWSNTGYLSSATEANPITQNLPLGTTQFIVVVTNGSCTNRDTVNVTVIVAPGADAGDADTICRGVTKTLGGSPTSSCAICSYSWSPTAALNDSSSPNPITSTLITRTYAVTVTDGNNCTSTASVLIHVSNPVAEAGANTSLCITDSVMIGGSPTATGGIAPYAYVWSPAASLSSAVVANPNSKATVNTKYTLTVTDNIGCKAYDSVNVTVFPLPVASVAFSDTVSCPGDTIQLFVSAGFSSYAWSPSSRINNTSVFNPLVYPIDTTVYKVVVTDANGCKDDTMVKVNVIEKIAVMLSPYPDTMICAGEAVQLQANVTGATSYAWTPTTGLNNPAIPNPIATPGSSTTYTITANVLSAPCPAIDTVRIIVSVGLTADAGIVDTVCAGTAITVGGTPAATGGITPYTYAWSSLPVVSLSSHTIANPTAVLTTNTLFTLTVTDTAGCSDADDVMKRVYPDFSVYAGPDTTICFGKSIAIGGSPTANPPASVSSYAWSPVTALNDPSLPNPLASPLSTTAYTVKVIDVYGCSKTDTMLLSVLPAPSLNFSFDSICIGDSIQLNAVGGTSYSWSPSTGLSAIHIANPKASPVSTTTYRVIIASPYCSPDTGYLTVKVNPLPMVIAGPDTTLFRGEIVELFASGAVYYVWSPADAFITTTDIANPQAQPLEKTQFIVEGSNVYGCKAYDTVFVDLISKYEVYIPNAFAPNGEVEENRKFCIRGVGIKSIDFKIFNRWGQLVFSSTNINDCWDGRFKGQDQQMQSFGYWLVAEDYDGNKKTYKGTITIIR